MKIVRFVFAAIVWLFLVALTSFACGMIGLGIGQFVWDYLKLSFVLMAAGLVGGVFVAEWVRRRFGFPWVSAGVKAPDSEAHNR